MTAQNHRLTSVIMVTYHTGPALEQAIAAVLAQTADVELVLVNNGNPPEIEKALMERFRDDPAVRLLTGHGNIGLSKGYNLGIRMAAGDYVLFLSPRCVLPPHAVTLLLDYAQVMKRPFMLGARLVDETGGELACSRRALLTPQAVFIQCLNLYKWFPKLRLRVHLEPVPTKITQISVLSGSFMFMAYADCFRLSGFDERYFVYSTDLDFCARFQAVGGKIGFIPNLVVKKWAQDPRAVPEDIEKQQAKALVLYLHENFGDRYFQPLLWMLYAVIWGRAFVRRGLKLTNR